MSVSFETVNSTYWKNISLRNVLCTLKVTELVKFIKPSLGLGIMFDLFTIENFGNLIVLLVLQAVLGFDNLLYDNFLTSN